MALTGSDCDGFTPKTRKARSIKADSSELSSRQVIDPGISGDSLTTNPWEASSANPAWISTSIKNWRSESVISRLRGKKIYNPVHQRSDYSKIKHKRWTTSENWPVGGESDQLAHAVQPEDDQQSHKEAMHSRRLRFGEFGPDTLPVAGAARDVSGKIGHPMSPQGFPMQLIGLSDFANLVTAIATAVTAVLLLIEYRHKSRQTVKIYRDAAKDGWAMIRIHIFPVEAPSRITRIESPIPILSGIEWETGSDGRQIGRRTHESPVSSVSVAIDVDSCRVSEEATVMFAFVCFNAVKTSEITIRLRCRRRLVPYTLKASIRTNT